MKFISGFFKIIAFVLMAIVVFSLPVALLFQGVGSLLLSPGKLVEMLDEHILDPEIISNFARYQVGQIEIEPGSENAVMKIALDGMNNFDDEEWMLLIDLIAPPELISETLEDGLSGYFRWLEGSNPVPSIEIDLKPWKRNLSTNFIPVLELVMYALPECTDAQQQQFLGSFGLGTEMVSCRPQDPIYSLFIEQAGITVPSLMENMPDEFNFGQSLAQSEEVDWAAAKESLSGLAFLTQTSWVVLLVMFAMAIPMGARSFSGVFSWAGWPILVAGVLTLITGALLLLFSQGGMADFNPAREVVQAAPPVLIQSVGRLMGAGMRFVARPLIIEAGAMILLGGAGVILAIIIGSRSREGEVVVSTPPTGEQKAESAPTSSPKLPAESIEKPLDQQPEEDDTRPSGMFG